MRQLLVPLGLLLAAAATAGAQDRPPVPLPPGVPPPPGRNTEPESPAATDVVIQTSDKLSLAATYWPARAHGGAGVVLLHMYGSDRSAWKPLVEHLAARGVAALAVDLRGHGGSARQGRQDLAPRVEKRDPRLFAEMHRDALAAVEWLGAEGRCDPARIALVGASVGCSVAVDAAGREPGAVAAVLCMSPGAKYLGLDTVKHVGKLPEGLPLLLLVHRGELGSGAQSIADARPSARLVVYDDAPPDESAEDPTWAHGTRMFGRLPLVEQTVASFVAARTGSPTEDVVLDGIVAAGEGSDPWERATEVAIPGSEGSVRAFRVGTRLVFGGTAPARYRGLRFEVQCGSAKEHSGNPPPFEMIGPPQVVAVDLARGRPAWSFGGMGSAPRFPGMPSMFGQTRPVLRVVRDGDRVTFEGEWLVPPLGADGEIRMRLAAVLDETLHPAPRDGSTQAHARHSVEVPAR